MAKKSTKKATKANQARAPKAGATAAAPPGRTFKPDPRLPAVGTVIERAYKGKTLKITVEADGLLLDGTKYASASSLARAATGAASINGYLFLGLAERPAPAGATEKPAKAPKAKRAAKAKA